MYLSGGDEGMWWGAGVGGVWRGLVTVHVRRCGVSEIVISMTGEERNCVFVCVFAFAHDDCVNV